jgi:hypothetical protein
MIVGDDDVEHGGTGSPSSFASNKKKYHDDNGVLASKEEMELFGLELEISGASPQHHHQKQYIVGVAERALRTCADRARMLMLHAVLLWHVLVGFWRGMVGKVMGSFYRMRGAAYSRWTSQA